MVKKGIWGILDTHIHAKIYNHTKQMLKESKKTLSFTIIDKILSIYLNLRPLGRKETTGLGNYF